MLRESRADIRQGISADLLERERAVQTKLNSKSDAMTRLLTGKAEAEKVEAARKEVEAVRTELQEVQAQIRSQSPRYAALTQPQPLSLAEIQKQTLDSETTLLEYSLGKERSYLWVVTQTSIASFELPGSQKIEDAAKRLYDILNSRNKIVKFETVEEKITRIEEAETNFDEAAQALSAMILEPAADQLKTKKLLIVADGVLQYIPFSVLSVRQNKGQLSASGQQASERTQKRPLHHRPIIVDHEIVNLPSASTLGVMRSELAGRKPAPKSVAVFADPVFESDDSRVKEGLAKVEATTSNTITARRRRSIISEVSRSARDTGFPEEGIEISRLPFTRREARSIASLVPASELKVALDFEASRTAAINPELSSYRYIHFATHSLINSRQPELSGIILSMVDERGDEQDGFLRAHEIFNLNLPAELVVLSGCQSGLGKQIRGEGILGITRGFMYAGAARVLVSLWDVDDEATAELMSRFYKVMLSKKEVSPATALREAQLSMWRDKRWRSAYYWAGFILQGEPN
jgi:CHAT domain-containing protein